MPKKKALAPSAPALRDRIVALHRVRASELAPNPDNWRDHPDEQRALLREMLDSVGFAGAELARRLPDGRLMLLDGHLRQEMATQDYGDALIPVLETDLTADEADLVLASHDPISSLASVNTKNAAALIQRVSGQSTAVGALLGRIASRQDDIRALLLGREPMTLPPPRDPWAGGYAFDEDAEDDEDGGKPAPTLRQPEGGEVGERYAVLAECADEREQRHVYDLLMREGITCRVLTL